MSLLWGSQDSGFGGKPTAELVWVNRTGKGEDKTPGNKKEDLF